MTEIITGHPFLITGSFGEEKLIVAQWEHRSDIFWSERRRAARAEYEAALIEDALATVTQRGGLRPTQTP